MTATATAAGCTPAASSILPPSDPLPEFVRAALDAGAASVREQALRESLTAELTAQGDQLLQCVEALAHLADWTATHLAPEYGRPAELTAALDALVGFVAYMHQRGQG